MKKRIVFVLFVLLAFSSFCFADGFDVGVSARVPVTTKEVELAAGLNLAGTLYFNNLIGIGIFGNVLINFGGDPFSTLIVDALLGPVFRVVDNRTFSLPIAVGVYGAYPINIKDLKDMFSGDPSFGAGANLAGQLKLGRSMHLYARLQGAYNFFNNGEFSIADGEWVVGSSIGIGFGRN